MSLFNEYQNKNFEYLTRYINGAIDESISLSAVEMNNTLIGKDLQTYEDLIAELTNQKENINDNALVFHLDEAGNIIPLSTIPIPIRTTKAERSWLYYYLNKPETLLFLDNTTIQNLKTALEKDGYHKFYPLNDKTYTVREYYENKTGNISPDIIQTFRVILNAIHGKKYIVTDNHTTNGHVFYQSKMIPFRLLYSRQTGTLSLSAYAVNTQDGNERSIKLNLANIKNTKTADYVEDYESYYQKYLNSLNKDYEKKPPVTIQIMDYNNGFDRTVYTLANFKRESYLNYTGYTIMNIYYRRFQENELIQKLLSLGSTITILNPQSIKDKYVNVIKKTLQLYP